DERYRSARDMADALRAATERPDPRSASAPKPSSPRGRSRLVLATAALMTIGVLVLLYRGRLGALATPEETAAPVSAPASLPAAPASSPNVSPFSSTAPTPPSASIHRHVAASPKPPATASPSPTPTQAAAPSPAAVGGLATPVPSASP